MEMIRRSLRWLIQRLNKAILRRNAMMQINPKNDRAKEYEVELWLKITGRSYDFMSDYKGPYYDQLTTDDEKQKVCTTLVAMLKSDSYSISKKTLIAYVCADIGIKESLQAIKDFRVDPTCSNAERFAFTLAYEKLLKVCG